MQAWDVVLVQEVLEGCWGPGTARFMGRGLLTEPFHVDRDRGQDVLDVRLVARRGSLAAGLVVNGFAGSDVMKAGFLVERMSTKTIFCEGAPWPSLPCRYVLAPVIAPSRPGIWAS